MNRNLFPGEPELGAAKILIIDDEDVYVRTLEWVLRQAGFSSLLSLTDSTKARAEFERFQPDLVLLDLHMPGMDGFAVLQQFREVPIHEKFLPILILTGDSTADIRRQALAAGATDFLSKPVDNAVLIMRINNLLLTRFLHRRAQALEEQIAALTAARGPMGQAPAEAKP